MISKVYAVFIARLREFYRDRASLGWNFVFPFFLIIAFYFIFNEDNQANYKIGVISSGPVQEWQNEFFETKYVQFLRFEEKEGLEKVRRHKIDFLVEPREGKPWRYWMNSTSANGYLMEKVLKASVPDAIQAARFESKEVSYVDWVFPGVLAMNIMFSCLWGIGYIIVKYRQDGYLKRLNATPLKPYQFLLGQVLARYVIAIGVTAIVLVGGQWMIGFEMKGSYFDLFIAGSAGIFCLITIGMVVATRTTSKEFADGILNILSWPMMILSEVWFSLEGASEGVHMAANFLPLTHFVRASRAIMTDGVGLAQVYSEILILLGMSAVLLVVSSLSFKWDAD